MFSTRWWHTLWQYVINVDNRDQAAPSFATPTAPSRLLNILPAHAVIAGFYFHLAFLFLWLSHHRYFISNKVPVSKNYNKNVLSCLHRSSKEPSRGRCVCRTAQSDIFIQSLSFPFSITPSKALSFVLQRDSLISDVNHGYWSGAPFLGPLRSLGWKRLSRLTWWLWKLVTYTMAVLGPRSHLLDKHCSRENMKWNSEDSPLMAVVTKVHFTPTRAEIWASQ